MAEKKGAGKAKGDSDKEKTKAKGGSKAPAKKDGPKKTPPPKRDEPKAMTAADLPDDVRKSMQAVIDYSMADETSSAEESYRENGTVEGHVFLDLVTMKNFLDGTNIDPLDLLDVDDDDDDDGDGDDDEEE